MKALMIAVSFAAYAITGLAYAADSAPTTVEKSGVVRSAQRSPNAAAHNAAPLPVEGVLPTLNGAVQWLNSPPLTVQDLRGKVVLVDFWTYSCINSLRSLP